MILFKSAGDLRDWLSREYSKAITVGFVPTMGALHEGHIALIGASRRVADITICSIFVNPLQFNDPKDFEKYPVTTASDVEMLTAAGTDVLFLPSVTEIYPYGQTELETYDLGGLESVFEGQYRPGHFQGVCQVMSRLLRTVQPQHLFMGQKDYQQCMVVKRLIGLLHLPIVFHTEPTIREPDGLAKSSRNRRLSSDQRLQAVAISESLNEIRQLLKPGGLQNLLQRAESRLKAAKFRTDYVSIADAADLHPVSDWNGTEPLVALIAAFQGEVRLIDNMLLN